MIFPDDYEDQEREEAEREMPDMGHVWPPAPCVMCKKEATRACMHCGEPVCINLANYMKKSTCGDWILDWWTDGAMDPDDGNQFWCINCLAKEYGIDPTKWQAPEPEPEKQPVALGTVAAGADDFDPFLDSDDLP